MANKSKIFTGEKRNLPRAGKKKKAEKRRIASRSREGFEPISWVDPDTGGTITLSQMGRNVTRK